MDVIRTFADFYEISTDELIYDVDSKPSLKQGPKSKLERQFEQLRKLPAAKQKLISEMLDGIIKQS